MTFLAEITGLADHTLSFTAILFGRVEAETDKLIHFLLILRSVIVID
jgi:hypothetical protein